jgi:hypothetical protein
VGSNRTTKDSSGRERVATGRGVTRDRSGSGRVATEQQERESSGRERVATE